MGACTSSAAVVPAPSGPIIDGSRCRVVHSVRLHTSDIACIRQIQYPCDDVDKYFTLSLKLVALPEKATEHRHTLARTHARTHLIYVKAVSDEDT